LKKCEFNSGQYIHLVVEAMKFVHEDQEKTWKNRTDSDEHRFQFALSQENILKHASQIDSIRIKAVLRQDTTGTAREIPGSTHISIVDRNGNAVSISLSSNSNFGSGITIPKYGILLNNSMRSFSADAMDVNAIKPGKRPKTNLTPTLVIKNGRPFLVLGGNGNEPIISMLAHIIVGVVDFNLTLKDAITAPRFHYDYKTDTIEMETRIESETIEYLKRLGHKINLRNDYDVFFGSAQGVMFDPADSNSYAANDVRHSGVVYIDYQN
jgi:gamma-glutamyltranspeptidase/glutathione hydrolase